MTMQIRSLRIFRIKVEERGQKGRLKKSNKGQAPNKLIEHPTPRKEARRCDHHAHKIKLVQAKKMMDNNDLSLEQWTNPLQ